MKTLVSALISRLRTSSFSAMFVVTGIDPAPGRTSPLTATSGTWAYEERSFVMMSTRAFRTCLPVLLVVCVASNAAAQQSRAPRSTQPAPAGFLNTPSFELSGGYQMLHIPDQTFPFGLNVDAAKHFGQLGLVAEVGFAFDSEDISGVEDVDATAWNFGAGGRWTGFNGGRVWPFAQMLVGAEVMRLSTEIADVDVSDTETSFMLQPGVGVNFVL